MRNTVLVSAILAKLKPWASAKRTIVMGPHQHVLAWAEDARTTHNLNPSEYDVLRVVVTHARRATLDGARLCIAWITERVSWSRRTVQRCLASLRAKGLLLHDGQVPVREGRPVVKYRAGSTPECPLPEAVMEAREARWEEAMGQPPEWEETAGEGGNGAYHKQTEGTATENRFSETPSSSSSSSNGWGYIYRPAKPVKTEPFVASWFTGGAARRPTHLKRLRRLAEGFVARRGGAVPNGGGYASQEAVGGIGGWFYASGSAQLSPASTAAVTYCHTLTRGPEVTPFTDPALGALSRDTRLFHLGLLDLHARHGDNIPADTTFLKAEIFRYDDDIDHRAIQDMLASLAYYGKIHLVDGGVLLSTPPATPTETVLFEVARQRPARRTAVPNDTTNLFELFWQLYPRRTGKGAARKAFIGAVGNGTDPRAIITAASCYADNCKAINKEIQFIPHPATWLNQERYEDDVEQAPEVRSRIDDALRSGLELVGYYQQQEALGNQSQQKALEW